MQALWAEVERHPAVAHPFLRRFAEGRLAPWQIWGYASQHYRLVGSFTAHLEKAPLRLGFCPRNRRGMMDEGLGEAANPRV